MRAPVPALTFALLAVAVPAHAGDEAEKRIVTHFSEKEILGIAEELGGATREWKEDGRPYYRVTMKSGLKLIMRPSACHEERCFGLEVFAFFDPPEQMGPTEIVSRVNKFNETYSAGKAFTTDYGKIALQDYIIADHGVTFGNVKSHVKVFLDMVIKLRAVMDGEDA